MTGWVTCGEKTKQKHLSDCHDGSRKKKQNKKGETKNVTSRRGGPSPGSVSRYSHNNSLRMTKVWGANQEKPSELGNEFEFS